MNSQDVAILVAYVTLLGVCVMIWRLSLALDRLAKDSHPPVPWPVGTFTAGDISNLERGDWVHVDGEDALVLDVGGPRVNGQQVTVLFIARREAM